MARMKILFITATRLGDAVLSTGLLDYMVRTWPEGKVTVACGPIAASIFEGFPNVERVIALIIALLDPERAVRHFLKRLANGLSFTRLVTTTPPSEILAGGAIQCANAPDTS